MQSCILELHQISPAFSFKPLLGPHDQFVPTPELQRRRQHPYIPTSNTIIHLARLLMFISSLSDGWKEGNSAVKHWSSQILSSPPPALIVVDADPQGLPQDQVFVVLLGASVTSSSRRASLETRRRRSAVSAQNKPSLQ